MISVGIRNNSYMSYNRDHSNSVVEDIAKHCGGIVKGAIAGLQKLTNTIYVSKDTPWQLLDLTGLYFEFFYIKEEAEALNLDLDALIPDEDPDSIMVMNMAKEFGVEKFLLGEVGELSLEEVEALGPTTIWSLEKVLRKSFDIIYNRTTITPIHIHVEYEK